MKKKVAEIFKPLGVEVKSIHHKGSFHEKVAAIEQADCIIVGGGNTFNLVYEMYNNIIMSAIAKVVKEGKPFMGWSAGANIACPTLGTSNDMPIIEPKSFNCLDLVPFQINPHYLDANPKGHGGETREMRIDEFLINNININVTGLREGCMFEFYKGEIKYIGDKSCRIFNSSLTEPYEIKPEESFDFLMK